MAAAEGSVVLKGRPVHVREGDLILSHDKSVMAQILGPFNSNWSHVTTIIAHDGRLRSFSVYMRDGLVIEDLEVYNSDYFTRLAIVRPYPPRTAEQTLRLRLGVAEVLRAHADNPTDAYDPGVMECLHAFFRLKPWSNDRYICSELAARLAQAAGVWPKHLTLSVKVDDVARAVGIVEEIY